MAAFGKLFLWVGMYVFCHGWVSVVGESCTVADVAVIPDFDLNKFYGEWFSHLELNAGVVRLEDISHTYQPDGRGGTDVFVRERIPNRECSYTKLKLNAGRTGKLSQVSSAGESSPFWVISTDYTSFAVIYGCSEVGASGRCTDSGVRSSVWVRRLRHALPENELSQIRNAMLSVCSNYTAYSVVKHNQQGCRQCKPRQWTVQPNFSIDRFLGLWHVVLSVSEAGSDWIEEQHVYSRDGNRVMLQVKGRRAQSSAECQKLPVAFLNLTAVPAQMHLIRDGESTLHDYQVLSVEYERVAFVIGCDDIIPNIGECAVHVSWVLSRDKILSGRDALWIAGMMQQHCVPASLYTAAGQECSGVAPLEVSFGVTCIWAAALLWSAVTSSSRYPFHGITKM